MPELWRTSASAEFCARRNFAGEAGISVFKLFAAIVLGLVALVAGAIGALFVLFSVASSSNGQPYSGGSTALGYALVCGLIVVSCVYVLFAMFHKKR